MMQSKDPGSSRRNFLSFGWSTRADVSFGQGVGVVALFVLIAGFSLLDRAMAFYAAVAYVLCATVYSPRLGWALLIFVAPFQYLFAFDDTSFWRLQVFLLISLALVFLSQRGKSIRSLSPFSVVLLLLFVLISLHCGDDVPLRERIRIAIFFLAWIGVFEWMRWLAALDGNAGLALRTVMFSALFGVTVSSVFSIFAAHGLIPGQVPYFNFHQDVMEISLRLQGTQDNPNGLARVIAPALTLAACLAALSPRRLGPLVALTVLSLALVATGTKSVMVAVLCSFFLGGMLFFRQSRERIQWGGIAVLVLLTAIVSVVWVMPLANRHSALAWSEIGVDKLLHNGMTRQNVLLVFPESKDDSSPGPIQAILDELRLGQKTYDMKSQGGVTTYSSTDASLANTGQRLKTWTAGYETLKDHFWWGIGYGNWPKEMQARTGFPFSSPHNALLEITGSYGVLGAILYAAVFGLAARNYLLLRRQALEGWQRVVFIWSSLYVLEVGIFELVDVASVTTTTMSGAWFWIALAMQESLVLAARAPVNKPAA